MKKLNAILFALACIILISSCKKDDETPSVSKSELLAGTTSKSWKQISGKEDGEDYFSLYPACFKDDLYIFNANKNFEWNEGTTKCDPTDEQVIDTDRWEFKSNETVVSIMGLEATIVELTSTTLRIKYTEDGVLTEDTFTAL